MSTTTIVKVGVNLFEKAMVYMVNCLMQIGFRIEHGRVQGGHYMTDLMEIIERGLRVWLTEQKLLKVIFELSPPASEEAYERCTVEISYITDPTEEVLKPPIEQLEDLMSRLAKLPADAQFGLLVTLAPGYTEVPGWGPPTTLKELMGGVKEEYAVGTDGYGYGPIKGTIVYTVANWQAGQPPDEPRG
jgi:hypothetical protein